MYHDVIILFWMISATFVNNLTLNQKYFTVNKIDIDFMCIFYTYGIHVHVCMDFSHCSHVNFIDHTLPIMVEYSCIYFFNFFHKMLF